jgi:hypothetical protein
MFHLSCCAARLTDSFPDLDAILQPQTPSAHWPKFPLVAVSAGEPHAYKPATGAVRCSPDLSSLVGGLAWSEFPPQHFFLISYPFLMQR